MSVNTTGIIAWLRSWFDDIYVAKITGKGLSTNDYTTAEKNKLNGIEAQANKTVVDANLSRTSTNPVQNKAIYNNCLLVEDYELNTVSDKIPIKITIQGQYIRGMGFNDGDSIEAVLEEFAGRIVEMQNQWDNVYPVGSVYMSVNNVNPATLFGGTWERIKDKFLLASGDTWSNGTTGGSKDAVVVKHTHQLHPILFLNRTNGGNRNVHRTVYTTANDADTYQMTAGEVGVDGTDKNMPPYLTVNVWKRTA